MKRPAAVLALLVLCLGTGSAAAAQPASTPGILYAIDAKGPSIAQDGAGYRLSMPANASVTWFTDRPARRSGTVNLHALYAAWAASGFGTDPPNAALMLTHRGVTYAHVVELTQPRFARGRVSFHVRGIPGGTEAGYVHRDPLRAGRYGRADLFIDDAGYPPCDGGLDQSGQCIVDESVWGAFLPVYLSGGNMIRACSIGVGSGPPPTIYQPMSSVSVLPCPQMSPLLTPDGAGFLIGGTGPPGAAVLFDVF